MRKIIKSCAQCGAEFQASCGVERYCTNDCMFDASTDKRGECWEWLRLKDRDGYGTMRLKGRAAEKAHRFSYARFNGPLGAGMMVRHSCDNPGCVNPAHLSLGTALQNKRDAVERGRDCRGDKHHKAKLTVDIVRAIRASDASGAELAQRYGVTKENVYAIRKRQTWNHA